MKKNNKQDNFLDGFKYEGNGHKSLSKMSRRELLGQGFISGSGMLLAPSLLSMISAKAMGADSDSALFNAYNGTLNCGTASLNPNIPYLSLDLAGGAAISGGNVLVGTGGTQTGTMSEAGYRVLGYNGNPIAQGEINTELGLAFHSDSGFLRGIMEKTTPECRANINGAVACSRSGNDTQNNPHNPIYGINQAGASGAIATLAGNSNSDSGGNSMSPAELINSEFKPIKVSQPNDLQGTIDTGKMVQDLGGNAAERIMRRIANLSQSKRAKITEDQVKKDLLQCGYLKAHNTVTNFSDPNALNVYADADMQSIFNVNSEAAFRSFVDALPGGGGTDRVREKHRQAISHAKAVVNGFVGGGVMSFGGYDYHNGTRATGDRRDYQAGQAMGIALQYAHIKQVPLFLYVFSDGSVRSNGNPDNSEGGGGKGEWTGDSGGTSAAFILVYNPAGRPAMRMKNGAPHHQLGSYTDNGSVDTDANLVSNSPRNLAYWVLLNYMALHGRTGQYASVFPQNPIGTTATELDPYINFESIRG